MKKQIGFALMSHEKHHEAAVRGGRNSHLHGAHEWTPEEARIAGLKGNRVPNRKRGFNSMSPERHRKIAAKGGRIAHQRGTAHRWTSEEARKAGIKPNMKRHIREFDPA